MQRLKRVFAGENMKPPAWWSVNITKHSFYLVMMNVVYDRASDYVVVALMK